MSFMTLNCIAINSMYCFRLFRLLVCRHLTYKCLVFSLPPSFSLFLSFFFFFFSAFCFLGPYPRHMEVSRLGLESELQLPATATATAMQDLSHICSLYHSSQQCWIFNPPSKARDQTHILTDTSWVHYLWPKWELLNNKLSKTVCDWHFE